MGKQNDYSNDNFYHAGLALGQLDRAFQGVTMAGMLITGFSARAGRIPGEEVLLVVRAIDSEETPFVAFHSAYTLHDAIRGLSERVKNGTLKWKLDEFRK